jgi:hypothetical protein
MALAGNNVSNSNVCSFLFVLSVLEEDPARFQAFDLIVTARPILPANNGGHN